MVPRSSHTELPLHTRRRGRWRALLVASAFHAIGCTHGNAPDGAPARQRETPTSAVPSAQSAVNVAPSPTTASSIGAGTIADGAVKPVSGSAPLNSPGAGGEPSPPCSGRSGRASGERADIVANSQQFSARLYCELQDRRGNLVFSPLGLELVLGMIYAGAADETASEVAQALGFGGQEGQVHALFEQQRKAWRTGGPLSLAARTFLDTQFAPKVAFTQQLRQSYGADVERLNFKTQSEASRRKINQWAKGTMGPRALDLLGPGAVGADTTLILTTLIRFHGKWEQPFDSGKSAPGPFRTANDKVVTVPFMNGRVRLGLLHTDDAQILDLPYRGDRFSLLIVVPTNQNVTEGLASAESALTGGTLEEWIKALVPSEMDVTLPRFSISPAEGVPLKTPLTQMGFGNLFAHPNLSNIAAGALVVDDVYQQARIEVDESGTVAAAATASVMRPTSLHRVLQVSQPFLFAVRDRIAGTVLFLGRVVDPSSQ